MHFRTDFTSSVLNFCRWVADVPPRETFPAAKSEEKRMFSQANMLHIFYGLGCLGHEAEIEILNWKFLSLYFILGDFTYEI